MAYSHPAIRRGRGRPEVRPSPEIAHACCILGWNMVYGPCPRARHNIAIGSLTALRRRTRFRVRDADARSNDDVSAPSWKVFCIASVCARPRNASSSFAFPRADRDLVAAPSRNRITRGRVERGARQRR